MSADEQDAGPATPPAREPTPRPVPVVEPVEPAEQPAAEPVSEPVHEKTAAEAPTAAVVVADAPAIDEPTPSPPPAPPQPTTAAQEAEIKQPTPKASRFEKPLVIGPSIAISVPTVADSEPDELPASPPVSSPKHYQNGVHGPSPLGPQSPPGTPKHLVTSGQLHAAPGHHQGQKSVSLAARDGHTVSVVLIASALETIANSKEARRSQPLKDSVQRALEMIRAGQGGDKPREIFEPLRLACETRNDKLMIPSLDCISKLISYGFLVEQDDSANGSAAYASPPASPTDGKAARGVQDASTMPLVDLVTHTITACYTDSTPDAVSLQIVKALLALVLSPVIHVHHSSLLKAVRTVYNVFLLSSDPVNQVVAQGGLTQIVNHVFARCTATAPDPSTLSESQRASISSRAASPYPNLRRASTASTAVVTEESAVPTAVSPVAEQPEPEGVEVVVPAHEQGNGETTPSTSTAPESVASPAPRAPLTLDTFEVPNPNDEVAETEIGDEPHSVSDHELFLKDAFLVFRALCKLTMKTLTHDSERDLKSHAMRSKLLSLHLVQSVLGTHMSLFVSPTSYIYSASARDSTPFVQATKQYLCLALSRNALSPVPQVFDICVEIFWRILSGLRKQMKVCFPAVNTWPVADAFVMQREIEVLMNEIFIPILEMRTATVKQKAALLNMLSRLCQEPQALVEIYLNYDCDKDAIDNIYERLMNVISKIGTQAAAGANKAAIDGPNSPVAPSGQRSSAVPPSLSTSALTNRPGDDKAKDAHSGDVNLRRLSLECLVFVLRSLVAWGTTAGRSVTDPTPALGSTSASTPGPAPGAADSRASFDASASDTNLATAVGERAPGFSVTELTAARESTPDLRDDPDMFDRAKQIKTTLVEGTKKFNAKPKKVRLLPWHLACSC